MYFVAISNYFTFPETFSNGAILVKVRCTKQWFQGLVTPPHRNEGRFYFPDLGTKMWFFSACLEFLKFLSSCIWVVTLFMARKVWNFWVNSPKKVGEKIFLEKKKASTGKPCTCIFSRWMKNQGQNPDKCSTIILVWRSRTLGKTLWSKSLVYDQGY